MDELEACGMFESSAIVETSYNSGDSIGNFFLGAVSYCPEAAG